MVCARYQFGFGRRHAPNFFCRIRSCITRLKIRKQAHPFILTAKAGQKKCSGEFSKPSPMFGKTHARKAQKSVSEWRRFGMCEKTHGLSQKTQAMYFKIQGTYFKIYALYFLPFQVSEKQQLTETVKIPLSSWFAAGYKFSSQTRKKIKPEYIFEESFGLKFLGKSATPQ